MIRNVLSGGILALLLSLQACGGGDPVEPQRYVETDQFVSVITSNIELDSTLQIVADIDHSRLGHEAGSPMPPSRVIIFSDSELESQLIHLNPLVALDLPLRVLAYQVGDTRKNAVTFNSFEYITSRYGLEDDSIPKLAARYGRSMAKAISGVPEDAVMSFSVNEMQPNGIVTIESPYDFDETVARVRAAIESLSDTMYFGMVDFQANAREKGIELLPSYMILFGGPGPGGTAMARAPTLGLDGFCQKFLIWQDEKGVTRLSFNDLLALARRQEASIPLVLRVIDYRLNSVFEDALSAE